MTFDLVLLIAIFARTGRCELPPLWQGAFTDLASGRSSGTDQESIQAVRCGEFDHSAMLQVVMQERGGSSEFGSEAASRSAGSSRASHQKPKEAGWFGDFDQAESTFDIDGLNANLDENPEAKVAYGIDMGFTNPVSQKPHLLRSKEFLESVSAGATAAWQSHPPVKGIRESPWRDTPQIAWSQGLVNEYRPTTLTSSASMLPGPKPASWFNNDIRQLDGFGRINMPGANNPRKLEATDGGPAWVERAVNTTISCAAVGCTGNATVYAYDPAIEEAAFCLLSVGLHATDFDEDFSFEVVKNWIVNGYSVDNRCAPMAKACNATAWRPLYSCITDFPVDLVLAGTGMLNISGTLSHEVDECPYNGNLLSGVVWVTCMVRPLVPTPGPTTMLSQVLESLPMELLVQSPLQCELHGCTANTLVNVDPVIASLGGSCMMNVTFLQTDFDSSVDIEQIEFISMEGAGDIAKNLLPGLNPCQSALEGMPLTVDQQLYKAVTNLNVTADVLAVPLGQLNISAKISNNVDECASMSNCSFGEDLAGAYLPDGYCKGYLLDALITVRCTRAPLSLDSAELSELQASTTVPVPGAAVSPGAPAPLPPAALPV